MVKYMHTLNGMPAQFYPNQGICFNSKRVKLANSLRQIRREQEKSKWLDVDRHRIGFRYGYVTVSA